MVFSNDLGWEELSVRVGFSAVMADRNARMTKDAAKIRDKNKFLKNSFPVTSQDYYLDTNQTHFSAKVTFKLKSDFIRQTLLASILAR